MYQYIVICLTDKTDKAFGRIQEYVQVTRKRFNTLSEAETCKRGICPSRNPVVVKVPFVVLDSNGYPV